MEYLHLLSKKIQQLRDGESKKTYRNQRRQTKQYFFKSNTKHTIFIFI